MKAKFKYPIQYVIISDRFPIKKKKEKVKKASPLLSFHSKAGADN